MHSAVHTIPFIKPNKEMFINQHRLEFENQLKVSSIYVLTYTYETLEYHILWFLEYILKIQLSFISLSNSRTHRNKTCNYKLYWQYIVPMSTNLSIPKFVNFF